MPYMINGCGTTVYKGRGDVGWGSFDSVEWFCLFYIPLIPMRSIHNFGWSGRRYQMAPLRWSAALVARSFLLAWRWLLIFGGVVLFLIGGFLILAPGPAGRRPGDEAVFVFLLALGAGLLLTGLVLHFLLRLTDRRSHDIRRVLDPHQLGSCDPALMEKPINPGPREVFGTDAYADAVNPLLDEGRFSRAMWAARLATAWEDPAYSEEMTDQVLRHPGVAEAVEQVRRDPRRWAEVMLSPAERLARRPS